MQVLNGSTGCFLYALSLPLTFYPGGKVEETAYAPMLHYLAEQGMDVFLVKMPFRLAVFGMNKADHVMKQHDYLRRWQQIVGK